MVTDWLSNTVLQILIFYYLSTDAVGADLTTVQKAIKERLLKTQGLVHTTHQRYPI